MRVLLVYGDYQARSRGRQRPLGFYAEGLASLAAILKEGRHEVALLHLLAPPSESVFKARIRLKHPDLVGFTTRSSIFSDTVRYARWTREAAPGAVLVAGGYHATADPVHTLQQRAFDFVIRGEGEGPLRELCDNLEQGFDPAGTFGLCYLHGDDVVSNPLPPLVEDLDTLPLPDLGIFDLGVLESYVLKTPLAILSRGCPFNCSYCCNSTFRRIYPNKDKYVRFRDPLGAIRYLKHLIKGHGSARYLTFMDDILPLKRSWLASFLELYRAEIGLPFSCNARADLLTEETVSLLQTAGCYRIHLGVESGNDYIRRVVLNRRIHREEITRGFELCRRYGISTLSYNMVGLPEEDLGRVLDTVKLNAKLRPNRVVVSILYPYPGTDIRRRALNQQALPADARDDVILDQPGLSREEAVFVYTWFRFFVRAYTAVGRLPGVTRKPLELALERFFLWRKKPHRMLAAVVMAGREVLAIPVYIAKRVVPGCYLRLRDRSLRVAR